MIRQNLHCHTIFDDGADAPERMVLAAQAAGLGSLGISLHCPVSGQDVWCCSAENEPLFVAEMHRLREACSEALFRGKIFLQDLLRFFCFFPQFILKTH